jgi:hypothetical protein
MRSPADAEIAAYIETLHLEQRLDPKTSGASEDPELAAHELEWHLKHTWTVLEDLAYFFVPRFVPNGPKLEKEYIAEVLAEAMDEKKIVALKLSLRRSLVNRTCTLNDLVRAVHKPPSKEYGGYRKSLKAVVYGFEQIGLWDVKRRIGIRKSKEQVIEFTIEAGPLLWAFHRHVYLPWSRRQAQYFCSL